MSSRATSAAIEMAVQSGISEPAASGSTGSRPTVVLVTAWKGPCDDDGGEDDHRGPEQDQSPQGDGKTPFPLLGQLQAENLSGRDGPRSAARQRRSAQRSRRRAATV